MHHRQVKVTYSSYDPSMNEYVTKACIFHEEIWYSIDVVISNVAL